MRYKLTMVFECSAPGDVTIDFGGEEHMGVALGRAILENHCPEGSEMTMFEMALVLEGDSHP